MSKTVLIAGASGKIGRNAAVAFWNAGWNVRSFDRSTGNLTSAAIGADVIINGMNPPNYHNWAKTIPEITAQMIAAAKASGATVIIPGNVYNFGDTPGTWSETTPQKATTRKGKVRIEMEQAYRDAGVRTIVLRAGNFIEPNSKDDVMAVMMLREIGKGKITCAGDPDAMQAYCYLPDWADAARQLAEMRDQLAVFEDVPFPGHTFTVNDLRTALELELNRPLKLSALPWWFMKLASPFWEMARELLEMRYLWSTSHRISGEKFARLLPDFQPTDKHEVMIAGLPEQINPDQSMARRAGSGIVRSGV